MKGHSVHIHMMYPGVYQSSGEEGSSSAFQRKQTDTSKFEVILPPYIHNISLNLTDVQYLYTAHI